MKLREKIARAIWDKRPDAGLRGLPFPFADDERERRAYHTANLDGTDGKMCKVAACDLCFDYADAAIKVIDNERH